MDKDLFLKPRLPEGNVTIEDVGTIRVRGLSRAEVLDMQALTEDLGAMERAVLGAGIVDPLLTPQEVQQFHDSVTKAEVERILDAIQDLSGLKEGRAKAEYKSDGPDPGPGVRPLPGGEAGDDGGPPAG